jgi:hypothetical protein
MFRLRVMSAIAMGALWVGLLAPAVSAATGTTRWVDDNARADGGPKACAHARFTSIQAAIDASKRGDRVYVCPGTYTEQLVIDKRILVLAKPLGKATIQAPATFPGVSDDLVTLFANHARLRGFKLRIAAGDAGGSACSPVSAAISVLGEANVVRNNNIAVTGQATLTGSCGYIVGIDVQGPSARVTFNHVTDFKGYGIMLNGSSSTVVRNTVRFIHAQEAACDLRTPACATVGIFAYSWGDYIARNAVYSGASACISPNGCAPGTTPGLLMGMEVSGSPSWPAGETVDANAIYRTGLGIWVTGSGPPAWIARNSFTANGQGMQLDGNGSAITDNVVRGSASWGVGVTPGGHDYDIYDNDFRGNSVLDCEDASTGGGTAGTANTWTNNLGLTSLPEGLCAPPTQ